MTQTRRDCLGWALAASGLALLPGSMPYAAGRQELAVGTPPGLPGVVLARMLEAGDWQSHGREARLRSWRDPDQFRTWIARGSVQLSASPTNVAANLYNRGVPVVLLNVFIRGTLGVVVRNGPAAHLGDLTGKRIGVPWRGDMPDLVFRYVAQREGMSRDDFRLTYLGSPFEAVQMLLAKRLDAVVLPDPLRSAALRQAANMGFNAQDLDLQNAWHEATGHDVKLPQAGLVARRELVEEAPALIETVQQRMAGAVDWVNSNRDAAARNGAQRDDVPQPVLADALERTPIELTTATEAREDLAYFFGELATLSSDFIGGGLPDAGFYWKDSGG